MGQNALWAPRGPLAGSAGARGNVLRFAPPRAHAGLPKSGGHPSNVLCRPDAQPGRHDGTILAPAAPYRSRKRCPQPLATNGPHNRQRRPRAAADPRSRRGSSCGIISLGGYERGCRAFVSSEATLTSWGGGCSRRDHAGDIPRVPLQLPAARAAGLRVNSDHSRIDMIVLGRVEGSVPEAAPLCPLELIDPQ